MNNILVHYGVKGMKWGIRKYQDKSGRLTQEGKDRYASLSKKYSPQILEAQKRTNRGESTGENYDQAMAELKNDFKARTKERNKLYKEYGVSDAIKRRDTATTDKEYAKASRDIESALNKAESDPRMGEIWKGYADKQVDVLGGAIAKDLKIKNEDEVKDYVSAVLDRNANVINPSVRTSNDELVSLNPYLWKTYNKVHNL